MIFNRIGILKQPAFYGILIFMFMFALTQFIAYEHFLIDKQKEKEALLHELSNAKDRFRNILYNDIAAANTLAIIYKEFGAPKNFDSVASQVLKGCKYIDAIQLTQHGIITNVYPIQGRENTIGLNTGNDVIRQKEQNKSLERKDVYFAGPRALREGGVGILAKEPIIVDSQLVGLSVVLTKITTIKDAMTSADSSGGRFAYTLSKKDKSDDTSHYLLTTIIPGSKSESVAAVIPEGDWLLEVAYSKNFHGVMFPNELSAFGFLLSVITSFLLYRVIM